MPLSTIIVIGASAGGVEALSTLVRALPADLMASLFVTLHIPAQSPSALPEILAHAGRLPVSAAQDGAKIEVGHIYVAAPDHHLLVERGTIRSIRGPRENRHRPAIDPLFRSAARVYGPQVVGVILTGALDDGTAGLLAIKRLGGLAVVQDPLEALYAGMPRSAIEHVQVDYVLPLAGIAPQLVRLTRAPAPPANALTVPGEMGQEMKITELELAALNSDDHPGEPSAFSCPECGGVLWEVQDDVLRFRCRVGHAYTADHVLAAQSENLEEALWAALNTLEESVSLARRMARHARQRSQERIVARYEERIQEALGHAAVIRGVLVQAKQLEPMAGDGSSQDQAAA